MHVVEILVPVSVFLTIFGIFYLFLSTRNRERMALIEKGADASLFRSGNKDGTFRMIILNIALTLMGIGLGTVLALFLYEATGKDEVYPACIFFMAGLGLLVSFFLNDKYKKTE